MKKNITIISALVIVFIIFCVCWILYLQKAHGTFENYFNFRGCVQLLEKTDTYGTCKISSGQTIKIVEYQNKWYLDGDLPFGAKLPQATSSVEISSSAQIIYKNTEYGFTFNLPASWTGYSIINSNWNGNLIEVTDSPKVTGPEISIRHPLWTVEVPRQDIPILILTLDQWNLVQQEKLSLGAAPIPPSELGRNSKYVFALPARYNFAFPTGFEEVNQIIETKPLQVFDYVK